METIDGYKLSPTFGDSFGAGWKVMQDNFIRLLLIVIVVSIVNGPSSGTNFKISGDDFNGPPWEWFGNADSIINWVSLGMFAALLALLAFMYMFLVVPVFEYGKDFIFVQTVRKIKPDFELLVKGFWDRYLHIILAHLLVTALIILGCFMLIVPGIIIACRLVFVSYLVMDKRMDPIEAVEMSWKLTRGHGWTIFLMGFVSIFIIIFGLIMFIVGIFPAMIWISASFASLYQSVLNEKDIPAEVPAQV